MSGDTITSEKLNITVDLAGKKYAMKVPREQEAAYRKAAELVNNTYNELIGRYSSSKKNFDMTSFMSLAAMEISVKYQLMKEDQKASQDELKDLENDLSTVFN